MYVVIVDFVVAVEHVESFRARVLRQAVDSLANEPGCGVFDVCVDPNEPNRVVLYEVYDSAEAFQDHLNSPHFKSFDAEVASWTLEKTVQALERIGPR